MRSTYNIKRLQPGRLNGTGKVNSGDYIVEALLHDASTLGGNSGSAVIDIRSGQVVALHGEPLLLAARRLGRVSALSCGATEFVFLRIIMYYFVNALKF